MACLVPQFKCPSSSDPHFRHSLPRLLPKARVSICFRRWCVLSAATAAIDLEQIPKLEAHSTSSSACNIKPLTYVGAVGLPTKEHSFHYAVQTSIEANLTSETLLTSEEAVISAAAAEAVALARAALELARNAAQMIGKNPSVEVEKLESEADINWLERGGSLAEAEWTGNFSSTYDVLEIQEMQLGEDTATVKSSRQTERRARRARAAAKAAAIVIPLKSGSSGKKKRSNSREIDYSDPLRCLRGTIGTSKLLTAAEEIELSEGIQDLLKLERLQQDLADQNGCEPSFVQWAAAAGIDRKTLRKRLNHGISCKDKMIKSNIRLVVSVAKKYQGVGMHLEDLIQEGCRGLIRGVEKFDASKGFKFSTYAHWWIRQAIRKCLSEQSRTIRLPIYMTDASYKVREARKKLFKEKGRHPSNEEVAEAAGLSMKRLEAVMLIPKEPISLTRKAGSDENLCHSEGIADPNAETSEEIHIKKVMKKDVNKVLDTLTPKEKQVLRWRFGLEDGRVKTLQEIGELMGVSRERIRQIESYAFRELKCKKRTKDLQDYVTALTHF